MSAISSGTRSRIDLGTLSLALSLAVCAATTLSPVAARAQVEVVEEEEPDREVERGQVAEQGRGLQYGAHLLTPIYLTDVRRAGPGPTLPLVNPGGGVLARVGWELPAGFSVELQGGVAFNYVDQVADAPSHVLTAVDLRAAARYAFLNPSAFVPFVQLGVGARLFWGDWPDDTANLAAAVVAALHGGVGAQIELTPYFGLELGVLVDYLFAHDLFHEPGIVGLTPFAGVSLYLQDEDDPLW